MKKIVYFLVLFFLFSCSGEMGYYWGEDSQIMLGKVDTVLENYPYYNKGAFLKYYFYDSLRIEGFCGDGGIVINKFIFDMDVYDTFILVDQVPQDSICICNRECGEKKYKDFYQLPTYDLCEKAIKESIIHHYYIINKYKNIIYGPLNKADYYKHKVFLNMPDDVTFKFERKRKRELKNKLNGKR